MRFCPHCGARTEAPVCDVDARPTEPLVALDAGPDAGEPVESEPLLRLVRLDEHVATDGLGATYRATRRGDDASVWVRLFPDDLSHDPAFQRAFSRQVEACRQAASARLAKVVDTGLTAQGRLFLITEHAPGRSLREVIEARDLSGWVRVREMVLQILQALNDLHRAGVTHADLRPDLIVLEARPGGETEGVRLLGAALPLWMPEGEPMELRAGRLSLYAAPERFRGEPSDARADLYSLGAILHHVLVGQPPYPAGAPVDVARAVTTAKPALLSVSDVPRGIPPGFVHYVRYLMAGSPTDRPWDADEAILTLIALPVAEGPPTDDDLGRGLFPDDAEEGSLGVPLKRVSHAEPSVLDRLSGNQRARLLVAGALIVAIVVLLLLLAFSPRSRGTTAPPPPDGSPASLAPAYPGKVLTSAMSAASSSSITSRSTPRAMPAEGGSPSRSVARYASSTG